MLLQMGKDVNIKFGVFYALSCFSFGVYLKCVCAVIETSDPESSESCQPECTREYCQANPTEICSARSLKKHHLPLISFCAAFFFVLNQKSEFPAL